MISRAIASLADSALLLPASLLMALVLLALRHNRLALAWAFTIALGGAATLGAKLLFHACGQTLTDARLVSPSGHASLVVVFYGSLALLLGAGRPRPVRLVLGAAMLLLTAAVAVSRVRTGAHTPVEVAAGLAIGTAVLAAFTILHARIGRPPVAWQPIAAAFVAALALLGGLHFSLEHRIGAVAREIAARFDVCAEPERGRPSRLLPRHP